MAERAVVVLAKAPDPGAVMTRMTSGDAGLTPVQAAALQRACLEDIVSRQFPGAPSKYLWTRGSAAHDVWSTALDQGWQLDRQPSHDLGTNLHAAVAALPPDVPAIVLGTDSPDLPDGLIEQAFSALSRCDVVLGPAFDGGYYLVAVRGTDDHGIFDAIDWGGPQVLAQTLERARAGGAAVDLLPFWYDLDEVADLTRLRVHSETRPGGLVPHRPTRTLALLDTLVPGWNGETG